jgi:hypothetical protein
MTQYVAGLVTTPPFRLLVIKPSNTCIILFGFMLKAISCFNVQYFDVSTKEYICYSFDPQQEYFLRS